MAAMQICPFKDCGCNRPNGLCWASGLWRLVCFGLRTAFEWSRSTDLLQWPSVAWLVHLIERIPVALSRRGVRCLILFLHVYHCVDSRPITGTMAAHRSTLRKSPESDENVSVNRRRSCNSMKISIKCKDVGPDDRPTSSISFILFRSSIVRRQGVASHSFKWRTKVAVC